MALYGDNVRSPLEQVWRQFVPQGYDQALRNAFYNVAAVVFVVCVAAAAWSVYMIFLPFVKPLLWAVLCGSLLHPAKHMVTSWTRGWLQEVHSAGSLLSVSFAVLPLRLLDTISEVLGRFVVQHVRSVVTVTVILPVVYIIIHHTPTFLSSLAYIIVSNLFYIFSAIVSFVGSNGYIVLTLVMGYVVAVMFFWSSNTSDVLTKMSLAVWLIAAAGLSGLWPAGSVPIFIILCLLLITGFCIEVLDVQAALRASKGEEVSILEAALVVCLGNASEVDESLSSSEQELSDPSEKSVTLSPVKEEDDIEEVNHQGTYHFSTIPEVSTTSPSDKSEGKSRHGSTTAEVDEQNIKTPNDAGQSETNKNGEKDQQGSSEDAVCTPSNTPRPQVLLSASVPTRALKPHQLQASEASKDDSSSNIYLKAVLVACVLVELWQHNYLLPLLPLAMLYYLVKKLASKYLSWGLKSGNSVSSAASNAKENFVAWANVRRSAILPPPIRGVMKLLIRTDHHLICAFLSAVDAIVTLLLILGVIVFAVTASIFLAVQIQGESMALVTLGSQVFNSTVVNNPQFLELLPEGLGDVVSSALDEGYLYGREWIASMVRGMLGETDDAKAVLLEKQVVELWDRVYQAWVAAHPQPPRGPVVTSEAVALTFDSIVEGLRKTPGVVSFSFVSEVVRDNLGTVVSVLESVWSILLGNLSLAVSALTAAASLLLGGSLSLLNALISVVVFMTSLFYVLSASDSVYKPVAVLMNLAPGQMNHLGKAVEDAVNGVFIASLKMGAFYGMWTWLLHSLFSTNIVYIPAVLGALFGAVPLLGTYWAAIPGALELCWSHGSPTMAALLFAAQLLPMSCVDTAIYADIKGGSHPYLTGLAVAGGVFYWGAEGAILGPMLLCILKVATNIYAALIQSPSDFTRRFGKFRRTPTIT